MFSIRVNGFISLIALLFVASGAVAAVNPEDIKKRMGAGDPVAGKEKSVLCQSCHGEDGNSPDSNYPKLAGQFASYIQKQIHEFQDGIRKDPMMTAMAQSAGGDQDIQDIAAYFASQKQMKGSRRGLNKEGRAAYKRGKLLFSDGGNGCNTCHGKKGKGVTPGASQAPVIGGQHKAYIIKQLKAFGQSTRTNDPGGIMRMIAGFMAIEDMEAVATYISTL
ncbi:MAG: c-type cytochrome [Gallionella sp.]